VQYETEIVAKNEIPLVAAYKTVKSMRSFHEPFVVCAWFGSFCLFLMKLPFQSLTFEFCFSLGWPPLLLLHLHHVYVF
jgi:hypothetical protein